jgi:hypothetical protein
MNIWCGKKRGAHKAAFVIAASFVAFASSSVKAALLGLVPNQTIDFTATPAVDNLGLPTGPQIFASGPIALTDVGGLPLTGTVSSWVYDDTPSTNTLDFVYQVSNTGPATADAFKELTLSRFSTFMTNVGYQQTGVDPSSADRNGTNIIDWHFDVVGVGPGTSSDLLVVQTDATNYHIGSASVIDGGTAQATVQVPFAGNTVPEPASVSLIMLASGMMLGRRRRA